MTAMQDWLNIRPLDPRNHLRAFICALRGVAAAEDAPETTVEPVYLQRGVERC